MAKNEGYARRICGFGGAWMMALIVLSCAPGDTGRADDTTAASAGGVAATPTPDTGAAAGASDTAQRDTAQRDTAQRDTAQPTPAGGADTGASKQPQAQTADTSRQQTALASTRATKRSTKAPITTAATPTVSGDTAAALSTETTDTTAERTTTTSAAGDTGTSAAAPPAETASTPTAAPSDTDSTAQAAGAVAETQQDTSTRQTAAAAGGGGDKMVVSESVYNGWKVFNANCNRCHGDDAIAAAGGIAPDLRQSIKQGRVDHKIYKQTVVEGRIQKGMPPWKDLLTEKQIEDTWQYLQARSSESLPPGRPKRKEG